MTVDEIEQMFGDVEPNRTTLPIASTITPDEIRFGQITSKMKDMFRRKNHDYGNSFHDTWVEFGDKGIITALTQISHKYHRLVNLGKGTEPLVDESLDDTLLDMANYCILTMMELEKARLTTEKEN